MLLRGSLARSSTGAACSSGADCLARAASAFFSGAFVLEAAFFPAPPFLEAGAAFFSAAGAAFFSAAGAAFFSAAGAAFFSAAGAAFFSAAGATFFSAAGAAFSAAGAAFSATGAAFSAAGAAFSTTGAVFSAAGAAFSTTGAAFSTTGAASESFCSIVPTGIFSAIFFTWGSAFFRTIMNLPLHFHLQGASLPPPTGAGTTSARLRGVGKSIAHCLCF